MVAKVSWWVSFSSVLASSKSSNLNSLFDHLWLSYFNFLLAIDGGPFFGLSLGEDFPKFFLLTCPQIKSLHLQGRDYYTSFQNIYSNSYSNSPL